MDIEKLYQATKETLLEKGEMFPVLFVELAVAGVKMYPFVNFPFSTTDQRRHALARVGEMLANEHRGDEIREACFVIEMWLSIRTDKHAPSLAPSQDPHRREIIGCMHVTVDQGKPIKHSMYAAEMIRTKAGLLIDLLPMNELQDPTFHHDNPVLDAVVEGFQRVAERR